MTLRDDLLSDLAKQSGALAVYIKSDTFQPPIPPNLAAQHSLAIDADIVARLTSFEQAQSTVESVISELSQSLSALRSQHASLRQLLVAVNMLPAEVFNRIFLMSYYDIEYAPWRPRYARTVSSVCRQWRSIAISQGELWTTILLDAAEPSVRISVERACLQRSFDVTHSFAMQKSTHPPKSWIATAVCPPARWRSLNITLKRDSTSWKAFKKVMPKFSSRTSEGRGLERLTIDMYPAIPGIGYFDTQADLQISRLFPNLQSLHVVRLEDKALRAALSPTLVNLRLSILITSADLRMIFRECSGLRRLWLSPIRDATQPVSNTSNSDDFHLGDEDEEDEGGEDGSEGEDFQIMDVDDTDPHGSAGVSFMPLIAPGTLKSLVLDEDTTFEFVRTIIKNLEAPGLKQLTILSDVDADGGMEIITQARVHRLVSEDIVALIFFCWRKCIKAFLFANGSFLSLRTQLKRLPELESLKVSAPLGVISAFAGALVPDLANPAALTSSGGLSITSDHNRADASTNRNSDLGMNIDTKEGLARNLTAEERSASSNDLYSRSPANPQHHSTIEFLPSLLDLEFMSSHADLYAIIKDDVQIFLSYLQSRAQQRQRDTDAERIIPTHHSTKKSLRMLRIDGLTDEEVEESRNVAWDVRRGGDALPAFGPDVW